MASNHTWGKIQTSWYGSQAHLSLCPHLLSHPDKYPVPQLPKGPYAPCLCFGSGCNWTWLPCNSPASSSYWKKSSSSVIHPSPNQANSASSWTLFSLLLRFVLLSPFSHSTYFSTYSIIVIIFYIVFFPTAECPPRPLCSIFSFTWHSYIHYLIWLLQLYCKVDIFIVKLQREAVVQEDGITFP